MASEPSASDQGRQGVEPSSEPASTAQRTDPSEDENQSTTSEAEVDNLRERIREMELKMASMDKMNVFNKSVSEVMDYSSDDPFVVWNKFDPNGTYQEKVDFYADILFFMRKLRTTHQNLIAADREADLSLEARQTNYLKDDQNRKRFCNNAFMKGEDIRVLELEWEGYLHAEPFMGEDFSAPVEVISAEPDSKNIQQIMSTARPIKGYSPPRNKRIIPENENVDSSGQTPLPERIQIRSKPLIAILTEFDRRRSPTVAPVAPNAFIHSPEVHLRPYQELYYREKQLRDWLAMLEKRFENYTEVKRSSRVSKRTEGDDDKEREGADEPEQKSSLFQSTQSDQKETDPNKKSDDVAVNSSGLTEGHSDDAVDDDTSEGETSEGETSEDASTEDDTFGDKDQMVASRTYRLSHSISALLHLRCLMEFVDKEMKPKQDYIDSPRCTRIQFRDLWHLFKPGDEVIQQDGKQAFVVLRVQVPKHRLEEPWNRWNRKSDNRNDSGSDGGQEKDEDNDGPFRLHCAYIDFNGQSFGPVSRSFTVSPFGEPKSIMSLPVYPLRYVKDTRKRQELVSRGRMLLDVSKFKAMYYTGVTLDTRDEVDSQVVIDFTEALSDETRRKNWEPTIGNLNTAGDHTGLPCNAYCCRFRNVMDADTDSKMTEDYMQSLFPDTLMGASSLILQPRSSDEVLSSTAKLTETELLIMTYRVFGFVLRSRKWAQLDLGLLRLENTKARDLTVDAFEGLQLPDNHKELVTSLVVQHFRSKQSTVLKNEQTDLIQGKGKGLILLLHGAPGVGKTTTAEGIAQLFRRPLFQITCGDLGTTAKEVEAELEKNFSLASRWGCILLLDEADVFLSARDKWDFNRNGLVAVFLRVLEYYSGILFLTTNRIGDFDEAFSSRIHMSLDYPALDEEKTLKIFQVNLELIKKRFDKQGRSITFDISAVMNFARDHFRLHEHNRWNGRQIRNACQTALALAEFDALGSTLDIEDEVDKTKVVELQQKYFKTVQKAYLAFDKYLGDIQGTAGDNRAVDLKFRARASTMKQNNRNAFTQHEVARSATVQQNLYPEYPHTPRSSSNLSQSTLGFQGDPFDQGYGPANPNANMSQSRGHEQYQSQPASMQSYEGQSRGGPMAGREIYDRHPEGSQQYPTSHRFSQGGQRGQRFGSPQVSNRIIPSVEDERYPSPSYDDSPRPYRGAQRQSQGYNYDNPDDGAFAQNPTPPTQGPSSYNPDPGFRPRRDDAGN